MKNTENILDILSQLENFKKDNKFNTIKEVQVKIFPGKNDKYLSNGIRDLKAGKNLVFATKLKEAMDNFKKEPQETQISDHVFYSKLNQIQDKPFSKNEIRGTVGKYLMFSIYDKNLILISSLEIFQAHEKNKHTYDSLLFFKANRINTGYVSDKDGLEFVDIKTNGYIMKNSTDKLTGFGITEHFDSTYHEVLGISDFGNSFNRNKPGMWFGVSFTNYKKLFSLRVICVKMIDDELEKEFEKNRSNIIRYHTEEDLQKNELIQKITSHSGSGSLDKILARLKSKRYGANFIKIEPYDAN